MNENIVATVVERPRYESADMSSAGLARSMAASIDDIDGKGAPGTGTFRDMFSGETSRVRRAAEHYLTVFPSGPGLVRDVKLAMEAHLYTDPEVALAMRIFVRRSLGDLPKVEELPKLAKRGMPRASADRTVFHLEGGSQDPQNKMVARDIWNLYDSLVKIVSDDKVRTGIFTASSTGRDHVPYSRNGYFLIGPPESEAGFTAAVLGATNKVWRLLRRGWQITCSAPRSGLAVGALACVVGSAVIGLSFSWEISALPAMAALVLSYAAYSGA